VVGGRSAPQKHVWHARMIEDMTIRKFTAKTQHDYVQRINNFAAFLGRSPDACELRGRAQLPAASGCERRRRAEPQPKRLDAAVLFQGHACARRHL
jgi:hypothetical protein